ncbi:hypothetical protein LINPERHAP2_LOCUS25329 [Linum perenne]
MIQIWFGIQILKNNPCSFSTADSRPDSPTLTRMYLLLHKQQSPAQLETVPKILRSVSKDLLYTKPSFTSGDALPDSVLCTILSGKEFTESAGTGHQFSTSPAEGHIEGDDSKRARACRSLN